MGNSFTNIAVFDSASSVVSSLEGLGMRAAIVPVAAEKSVVFMPRGGPLSEAAMQVTASRSCLAIVTQVAFSDVLLLEGFRCGVRVFVHNSMPDYFPDLDPDLRTRADLSMFEEAGASLMEPQRLDSALRETNYEFAEDVLSEIFESIGFPSRALQFRYEDWMTRLTETSEYRSRVIFLD